LELRRHHLPFKSHFHFRFLLAAILNFGGLTLSTNGRSTSGSVPSVKSKSGVVENVGVAFEIGVAIYWRSKVISSSSWWPLS